jgi:hypothetical protein
LLRQWKYEGKVVAELSVAGPEQRFSADHIVPKFKKPQKQLGFSRKWSI